jgi:hypothetical protein
MVAFTAAITSGQTSGRDQRSSICERLQRERLAQLLDDPTARRMLRDVNVQDVPPVMTDDEEAVEYAESNRWHREEIHSRNRFPMVSKEDRQHLARLGSLGARFIQREMVLSESSKPSMRSSPWIRGAPQVGFSTTIRKINSRTSFGVDLLPTCLRTLEISRQYIQKPVRCQRTMVSGVTMRRDCFQADQTRRAITQKSLSRMSRLGRGCRKARFSIRRLRRPRKRRTSVPKHRPMNRSMPRSYTKAVTEGQPSH